VAFELKKDWPLVAIGGGAAVVALVMSSGGNAPGSPAKSKTLWPKVQGIQKGVQGRSRTSSNDSGSLATQVISDVIGQKTALAEAKDAMTVSEDQLTTDQNIAYRESNVQAQQSVNSEVPPPNGWTSILQSLIGGAASFFGGPVGAGVLGVQPQTGGGGSSWWNPFSWFGGGGGSPWGAPPSTPPWGGYYPYQSYPSPYSGSGGSWA
jgi:hypothetical protein